VPTRLVRGLPATGGLPVSVLTHGRADWIPDDFGVPQADLDQAEQTGQRYQRELAGRFGSAPVLVAVTARMSTV
jgi:hypothetical protein